MRLVIDLDGTICSEHRQFSRSLAKPLDAAVESLRQLRELGHTIIVYSARTWEEYEMTVDWLDRHKIPFDQLILGKPQGDIWIDDRALRFTSWKEVMGEIL